MGIPYTAGAALTLGLVDEGDLNKYLAGDQCSRPQQAGLALDQKGELWETVHIPSEPTKRYLDQLHWRHRIQYNGSKNLTL